MGKVEQWAEKQGLELAADCHLARYGFNNNKFWSQAFKSKISTKI